MPDLLCQLLPFLLLGHVLGDFVLQSSRLVQQKRARTTALAQHAGMVALAHWLTLAPVWHPTWPILVPLLALVHAGIDRAKIAWERRRGETLGSFAWDQFAHAACLVACVAVVSATATAPRAASPTERTVAILATAYLAVTHAGAAIVRLVLARHALPKVDLDGSVDGGLGAPDRDPATRLAMGRTIGMLERALGLTFVLLEAWAGLAGIVAAKSIARFKELERRHFGEYYLIGTLTSLLVTTLVGAATLLALS